MTAVDSDITYPGGLVEFELDIALPPASTANYFGESKLFKNSEINYDKSCSFYNCKEQKKDHFGLQEQVFNS